MVITIFLTIRTDPEFQGGIRDFSPATGSTAMERFLFGKLLGVETAPTLR
jgi:hypothetical protein